MQRIAILHATGDWRRADAGARLAEGLAEALTSPGSLVERECLPGPAVAAPDARWLATGRSLFVARSGQEPLPGWLGQLVYARRGRVRLDDVVGLPLVLGLVVGVDWRVEHADREGWRARATTLRRELLDEAEPCTLLAEPLTPLGARFSVVLRTERPLEAVGHLADRVRRGDLSPAFAVRQVPGFGEPLEPWCALGWEGRS